MNQKQIKSSKLMFNTLVISQLWIVVLRVRLSRTRSAKKIFQISMMNGGHSFYQTHNSSIVVKWVWDQIVLWCTQKEDFHLLTLRMLFSDSLFAVRKIIVWVETFPTWFHLFHEFIWELLLEINCCTQYRVDVNLSRREEKRRRISYDNVLYSTVDKTDDKSG